MCASYTVRSVLQKKPSVNETNQRVQLFGCGRLERKRQSFRHTRQRCRKPLTKKSKLSAGTHEMAPRHSPWSLSTKRGGPPIAAAHTRPEHFHRLIVAPDRRRLQPGGHRPAATPWPGRGGRPRAGPQGVGRGRAPGVVGPPRAAGGAAARGAGPRWG